MQKTPLKIFIIILNFNGKEDTLECLSSLFQIQKPSFEIIVVDNGSKDQSVPIIQQQFPSVCMIENKENLGFAEGNNVGIKKALKNGADLILLLNNDTTVDKDFLMHFVEAAQNKKKGGIFGAKILKYHHPQIIDHIGGMWSFKKGDFISLGSNENKTAWQTEQQVDYVCGCCLLLKREVIEKIGFLDPQFFLLWEESDFCTRAKKEGFEIWTVPKAMIWHKISASFSGGKIHSEYFWWRNRLLWIQKNLLKKEKFSLYFKVILPEMLHLYKITALKSLQLFLLKIIQPKKISKKKVIKLLRYKAKCKGITDFFFKRFGPPPFWITNPTSTSFYSSLFKDPQKK